MAALPLAETLFKSGQFAAARKVLQEAVAPGARRDFLLGHCAFRLGDLAGAVLAFNSVLQADPRHAEAASALAALQLRMGRADAAEEVLQRTLARVEDDRLRLELGVLHWQRGRPEPALRELDTVLARAPGLARARLERATMRVSLGQDDLAREDLERLLTEMPGRAEPPGLLGMLHFRAGRYAEALPLLREVTRLQPASAEAQNNLCSALVLAGETAEAAAAIERLHALDPARWQKFFHDTRDSRVPGATRIDPRPLFLLAAYQDHHEARWDRRERFQAVLRDLIADPGDCNPVRLAHCAGLVPLAPAERLRLMRQCAQAGAGAIAALPHVPSPVPARLRIGYVFTHLGGHVVAKIMLGLVAAHDPAAVEVHAIAVGQGAADLASGMVERFAALPGVRCHDLTALDDAAAAAQLRGMGFDVLVDLAIYNDGGRPGLLAHQPAPVQVNFLGAPYSSGAPWLQYIVTDPVVSPGVPDWCSEAEARMPACYFVYGPAQEPPPAVPQRSALGLPEDRFLFSALNNGYKIEPTILASWLRILAACPDSLLLLKGGEARLRAAASAAGIAPERLLFLPHVSSQDYLLRQGMPDLFLDTRYYGAHTTMAESLWMGVPGVSCLGDAFQSRVGASLLTACGLAELVAPDLAAYEALAIALFHDRARLQRLKERLRATRLTAAPFDLAGQARALEAAYRHMRQRFADGLPPAAFNIADLPAARAT